MSCIFFVNSVRANEYDNCIKGETVMNPSQLGILLAIVFVVAIIIRINVLKKTKAKDATEKEEDLDDPMQKLFFEKTSNGSKKIHFLDISGSTAMQNIIVLKNIFNSENIPYYSEFEKFNALYGGIITSIKFYILDEDYEAAIEIVNNYSETSVSGITVIERK